MTKIRNSAPVLRFKDEQGNSYPDWEEKKLGEIGKVVTGKTPRTTNKSLWGGEIQFITPSDINDDNKYQISTERYIKQTKDIRVLPLKSIIYTCIASIGKICISVKPCATNQQINALTPGNSYDSEFIYYSLLKLTPRIKATQATTTLPIINKTEYKKINMSIPCLSEQQNIASFLSSVDTKIEQLGKKKVLLGQYKKGMMQKLFSQEIRFKDEQRNEYPDWKERRFDEIANIVMGTSPKSSAYNHSMEGLPLIQGNADVKNRRSAPRIFTSEITKECLPNDTLLSVRAPVGEVSRAIHHACIGRGISAVRVKAIALQDYIFHYLVWYEPKWKGLSQGSTFESVNTKSIESLEILVPSKLEQQKFADFLSAIDKKIELTADQLEQARTFKKGLLQQMFI